VRGDTLIPPCPPCTLELAPPNLNGTIRLTPAQLQTMRQDLQRHSLMHGAGSAPPFSTMGGALMALQRYVSTMSVDNTTLSATGTTIQKVGLIPLPPPTITSTPEPTTNTNTDYYGLTGVTNPQRPPPPPPLSPILAPAPAQVPAPLPGSVHTSKAASESASPTSEAVSVSAPQQELALQRDSPVPSTSCESVSVQNKQPIVLVTSLSYRDIVANISYPIPCDREQKPDKSRPTRRRGNRGRTPTPRVPTETFTMSLESPVSPEPDIHTGDLIRLSDSPEQHERPRPSLQITMEAGARAVREHPSTLDELLFN
jgi:hypothetical protein